jgi:sterol desaturase/sphingolipid hydroxylase (fatty acid hydroxylase superfamily)
VISFIIVSVVIFPVQQNTIAFTTERSFGLLHIVNLPIVVEGIIAFLLMDLAFYYWHLLNHKVSILWRFHNVHHFDPDLDVSTAFRFHFVEIGLSTLFRVIQISIIGVSPITFLIYELCFTANTIFQHSNIRIPIKIERVLNKIIVTPRMHGVHHSHIKNETNSNYSTVFSWWDILHKTIRLNIPQNKIIIGVPAYSVPEDNSLVNVILVPFKKQREYWKSSGGLLIQRDVEASFKERLKLEE